VRPEITVTRMEREDTATVLAEHCRKTQLDPDRKKSAKWVEKTGAVFAVCIDLPTKRKKAARSPGVRRSLSGLASHLPIRSKTRAGTDRADAEQRRSTGLAG
jgi:hypothetical protein